MGAAHEFGKTCEALAAESLRRRGWRVVACNYRFGHREIDLIVRRDGTVAFVEVKARRGTGYGHPLEAITWRKRREIAVVARQWIERFGAAGDTFRFDAIAVTQAGGKTPVIEHVEDAWRL